MQWFSTDLGNIFGEAENGVRGVSGVSKSASQRVCESAGEEAHIRGQTPRMCANWRIPGNRQTDYNSVNEW